MNKELCFCIDGQKLYLEHILVDYMDVPIFFLCKDNDLYYVVLCTDIDTLHYIIVTAAVAEIHDLLHGKLPMRDVILQQQYYWEVISEEDILSDVVIKHDISELDTAVLPEENACFEILTEDTERYVSQFDNTLCNAGPFYPPEQSDFLFEVSTVTKASSEAALILRLKRYVELLTCTVQTQLRQEPAPLIQFDGKDMHPIKKISIIYQSSKLDDWAFDDMLNMAA